jgi:hypothetical protein
MLTVEKIDSILISISERILYEANDSLQMR